MCIRGTFCDLATRIDGKFQILIEVKAIGLDLKDAHIKQAVDYAANQGIEWVALTNGNVWKVFRVIFAKPIDAEAVLDIDLLTLSAKNSAHLESLFLLTRESMLKSDLHAYRDQVQATNKFYLAAVVLSDTVLDTVRRELRRLSDVKLENDELRAALKQEVIKREVIEGDVGEHLCSQSIAPIRIGPVLHPAISGPVVRAAAKVIIALFFCTRHRYGCLPWNTRSGEQDATSRFPTGTPAIPGFFAILGRMPSNSKVIGPVTGRIRLAVDDTAGSGCRRDRLLTFLFRQATRVAAAHSSLALRNHRATRVHIFSLS